MISLMRLCCECQRCSSQKVLGFALAKVEHPKKVAEDGPCSAVRPFLIHLRRRPSREPEQLYQTRPRSDLLKNISTNILTAPHIHDGFSTRSWRRRRCRRILRTLRPSTIDYAPTILTNHRVALVLSRCADTVAAPMRSARRSTRVDSRRR